MGKTYRRNDERSFSKGRRDRDSERARRTRTHNNRDLEDLHNLDESDGFETQTDEEVSDG